MEPSHAVLTTCGPALPRPLGCLDAERIPRRKHQISRSDAVSRGIRNRASASEGRAATSRCRRGTASRIQAGSNRETHARRRDLRVKRIGDDRTTHDVRTWSASWNSEAAGRCPRNRPEVSATVRDGASSRQWAKKMDSGVFDATYPLPKVYPRGGPRQVHNVGSVRIRKPWVWLPGVHGFFVDPTPLEGQGNPERGVRLNSRLVDTGPSARIDYSRRPRSLYPPVWRVGSFRVHPHRPPGKLGPGTTPPIITPVQRVGASQPGTSSRSVSDPRSW